VLGITNGVDCGVDEVARGVVEAFEGASLWGEHPTNSIAVNAIMIIIIYLFI